MQEEMDFDGDDNITITDSESNNVNVITHDKECQAEIFNNCIILQNTFTCNRYIDMDNACSDAEIQTDMINNSIQKVQSRKMFKDKQCGTKERSFADKIVGPDSETENNVNTNHFTGITSIKTNEELLDLAGVTESNFKFLLKRLPEERDNWKMAKENRLFIFLIKIRTGLSFSAISILFGVHRTTVSRIFCTTLQKLSSATKNLVYWPEKKVVQESMPECFYPNYSNTRVIIDCIEFGIEVPSNPDNHVQCYSDYTKGFAAKLLIGITPSGFISFKSKVAGGGKTDSQMILESGLIKLLEDNDVIIADKEFHQFQRVIEKSGKNVVLMMPPFLEKRDQLTNEETEDLYDIPAIRIHIEKIMERLRMYQILKEIPENFFHSIEDIIHMCCVLVNLQSPIIVDKN